MNIKNIILSVIVCVPVSMMAQNVWERPDTETVQPKKETANKKEPLSDERYLANAVPEVNGKVEWQLDVDVPGKNAKQLYDTMLGYMTSITKEENQLEGSTVALVNKQDHIIVTNMKEWLVFKDNFIALDRTKFFYNLVTTCTDGHVNVRMNRLMYRYEEQREGGGHVLKAEEYINDKNALNKKKTKMYKGVAKFRRKTIDRKDYLFSSIVQLLTKKTQE